MAETPLKERILKYEGQRVPRYTSYPTAPHFQLAEDSSSYEEWLAALDQDTQLSLYVHVPFCPQMCHYCGCHTKVTKRYEPVEDYTHLLIREAAILSRHIKPGLRLSHLHFGGGSPTILRAGDFDRLMQTLREHFPFTDDAEIAIEIDPRRLTEGRIAAYGKNGVNRASLGVQDFDRTVMESVNRAQPFHLSYEAVSMLRDYGIDRINMDLMYGLPHQTTDTMRDTIDSAASLKPDRIALFGYAHVPWMKKHMRLIDETTLPDSAERYDLFETAATALEKTYGYLPVGIDHFVKPGDSMAIALQNKTLRRNFQGYTTDDCTALIGLGVSSIGKLPQGFIQNSAGMPLYKESIANDKLPVAKIKPLGNEDRLRAALIEQIMCYMSADIHDICRQYGYDRDFFDKDLGALAVYEQDGMVVLNRDTGHLSIPKEARHAVRMICAQFDSHFQQTTEKRHAAAI